MNDILELPAEANPLTEGILFNVLQKAASNDLQQIQTGTKQLQSWETHKGYYSLLQTLFIDRSLPLEVRYLAIIQIKNGIDRYWRRTAVNAIAKDEKDLIRDRLLSAGVNEADQRLALQNALVIAKIVRTDYPQNWPNVVALTIDLLRSSVQEGASRLQLPRTLLILHHVIKELATGRLQRTRAHVHAIAPEIFQVLGGIYLDKVRIWQSFLTNGGDDEGGALEAIEQSLLAIKVLRRLLVAGFEFPNRDKDVQQFWGLLKSQLNDFLTIASQTPTPFSAEVKQLIEKHLVQIAKLHLNMAITHPAAFVLLPEAIPLMQAYWQLIVSFGQTFGIRSLEDANRMKEEDNDASEDKSINEKLSLRGLLILRACMKAAFNPAPTMKYRHEQEKSEMAHATDVLRSQLFTDSLNFNIIEVLITSYFVFRPSDLKQWEEEPDEWERAEEDSGDNYEFEVRPCAEKLFLDILQRNREKVVPLLIEVFKSVASPDDQRLLFKDSVYAAIGTSAHIIREYMDFDSFLANSFVVEVQKQGIGYNLLRRRIAIVLSQWVPIDKVSPPNKHLVYEIYRHLLNKDDGMNDKVVRLTAGQHFRLVAEAFEFDSQQFMPYATDILTRIMDLIQEAEQPETKMALLNTVSVLVERLEHHITPFANSIVQILPTLWDQSGEQHLMKQAILTILARLVTAMREDSQPFHSLCLPIIKGALEPGSETQVYLLEDALDLWSCIIAQTPEPAPQDLLALAPYAFYILQMDSENLRKGLEITTSYVMLAPAEMLADQIRSQLFRILGEIFPGMKPEPSGLVAGLIELIIRVADRLGGEQAVEVMAGDMVREGLLPKIIEGLRHSYAAHLGSGPNAKVPLVDGIVETDYFSVLARLVLASNRVFVSILQAVANAQGEEVGKLSSWLTDEWFDHFPNIGDPTRRKLMCLALTKLLETGEPVDMLGKLQQLMTVWTDVCLELREDEEDIGGDSLVYQNTETLIDPNVPEAPEDARKRNSTFSDVIHTVNVAEFIRNHLQQAIAACGGPEPFQNQWLSRVDRDIVQGFEKLRLF